jgi:tRNA(Ile)-lysidine synthase
MNEFCPVRAAVRRFLREWPADAVGVVAVSGGPDSVGLLRALAMETTAPLVAAHLNHQLRGSESDADEVFVRELHRSLSAAGARLLPLECQRLDVRSAVAGDNLEAGARRLRYDWLLSVARKTNASWIATGHTADDQAETILHRLLRGTGLRGLAGIPKRRELAPGITVVRPLRHVRRDEVLAFLRELKQPFCQDSTNWDRCYTRSRLRHELLPLLATQYNPAIVEVLCRLGFLADEAFAFVKHHASKLLTRAELPRAGDIVVLDCRELVQEPPLLFQEAARLLWERENWPLGEMGFEDWQKVAEVVSGVRSAADFPSGVHLGRVGHVLRLRRTYPQNKTTANGTEEFESTSPVCGDKATRPRASSSALPGPSL